ncbi:MAG: TatD family hydrolase [Lachnospiraceae bacterium]|nr:TatD family hydrolase [Lachnospiraceae bacterium]
MIFESHAHYDDKAFDPDRSELLNTMTENGIDYIINIGSDIPSLQKTLDLAKQYPFIYGALGIHPSDTASLSEDNLIWVKEKIQKEDSKIIAIGEIGLDYYWNEPEHKIQKFWFKKQLELAHELNLPVVIHSREAAKDTLDILRENNVSEIGGVMHCFSYTKETACECLNMNLYIGIGGVITFKNARKIREAAAFIPLDKILLETDCPYLAPMPYRGKRNNSTYLTYVAKEIAAIKNTTYENVCEQTKENALRLFKINKSTLFT